MSLLKVGICITKTKKLKLKLPFCLFDICHKNGIEVVDIDMDRPLEEQGPFDIILHKILEWSNENEEVGLRNFEIFQSYINCHQNIILIDPIDTCIKLKNRFQMLEAARNCQFSCRNRRVFVPNFVSVEDVETLCGQSFLSRNQMVFPLIIKHCMGACFGKLAHDMSIVFDEENLKDLKPPCIVQQFHNHNGIMAKIYTIGEKFYLCKRPSIKNLEAGPFPTLYFNSSGISKRNKQSSLHDSDLQTVDFPSGEDKQLLEEDVVIELLQRLRSEFEFSLLGIDIIIDNTTGDYGIVDINYFPGYDGVMSHVPQDLVDLFLQLGRLK